MSKKKSFIINRQKWLRGEGSEDSYLLAPDTGDMCCIGFFEKAICGLKDKDIKGIKEPTHLISINEKLLQCQPKWFGKEFLLDGDCSADLDALLDLNDCEHLDDDVRETAIAAIFKKHNIEVKFVG